MCMYVKENNRFKLGKVNKEGYHTGWKIVTKGNKSSMSSDFEYILGENVSNRTNPNVMGELGERSLDNPKLYRTEFKGECISGSYKRPAMFVVRYGFHICPTRKEIRFLKSLFFRRSDVKKVKFIKVYFKPEDVVAVGEWSDNHKVKNIVVEKLTIKSLEPLR